MFINDSCLKMNLNLLYSIVLNNTLFFNISSTSVKPIVPRAPKLVSFYRNDFVIVRRIDECNPTRNTPTFGSSSVTMEIFYLPYMSKLAKLFFFKLRVVVKNNVPCTTI